LKKPVFLRLGIIFWVTFSRGNLAEKPDNQTGIRLIGYRHSGCRKNLFKPLTGMRQLVTTCRAKTV
jgi:hypothetical protein